MRRAINWFVVLLSLLFLMIGLTLTGCGSSGSDDGPGARENSGVRSGPLLRR